MNTDKADEPAFPRPFSADNVNPDISYPAHTGMTLRDYFAAKALQGLLAGDLATAELSTIANDCYAMADAMLEKKNKSRAYK